MKSTIKVLIISSYSKEEEDILNEFSNLFPTFESSNLRIVSRLNLEFGENLDSFFDRESQDAAVIVVFVSANLLGSKFIQKGPTKQAIDSENKSVIPVLIQSCFWEDINWVGNKGLLPRSGVPLYDMNKEDRKEEYTKVLQLIVKQSEKIAGNNISMFLPEKEIITFISHSQEDGDFADLLKLKLRDFGIKSWLDIDNVMIGQDWMEAIDYAITESDVIIVLLSPSARVSEYVVYEWAYALGKDKIVIPIKLEEGEIHPVLKKRQSIDFSKRTLRPWNELVRQINESVERASKVIHLQK